MIIHIVVAVLMTTALPATAAQSVLMMYGGLVGPTVVLVMYQAAVSGADYTGYGR